MSNVQHLKRQNLRNNEYYNFQKVQDMLYAKSKQGVIFTDLLSIITSKENILLAYRNIKKNKGSKTAGTDGKNISALANISPEEIVELVRRKLENFQPMIVKRVEIPKSDGTTRPLGIPTISDRLVQQCILQVMEPICEAKFYKHSYGFRPLKGAKEAIARAYRLAQRSHLHYVVDIDIKGFFDNINHGKLLKQIWSLGIRDKSLLAIISKLLKAKIENVGIPTKGTPQGGIISPLLANIVLNEFDYWIASQWENMPTKKVYQGYHAQHNKVTHALKKTTLKEVYIVRYADDFKLFCRNHNHAKRLFEASKQWLKERLSLEISPSKSKIVNLKKNYSEFLGIKLKVTVKGKTKGLKKRWVVKSHICDKAFEKILESLKEHIKNIQKPKGKIDRAVCSYNSFILGVHNYYSCATNVNVDFSRINYRTLNCFKNRVKSRKRKESDKVSKVIEKLYGKSKQLRFVGENYMIPIGYIKHRKVMLSHNYSPYVAIDRVMIHNNQNAVSIESLQYLIENQDSTQSTEYNDNLLSLYVGQQGKCFISGNILDVETMICKHKKPKSLGGSDAYSNLVLLEPNIFQLIYSNTFDINMLASHGDTDTIEKINNLRKLAKLSTMTL